MNYKVIISEDEIRERVKELGKEISSDFSDKKVILTGVLKGAYIFMSDLSRAVTIPHSIDFMAVSSYGSSTTSSGVVRILKDFDFPITNKHIILVEDIIDSGLTLKYLVNLLKSRSPASLSVCALLDKKSKHPGESLADYVGFEIPDKFVVGYGLDYDQYYRNLPYIAYLENIKG
ncbi:hypoxanthine phosphoribosyltransferase [bacterium]|nr:hypoxanthine phosphoribosyltransferase [candidate division CSSED10-310 bacterium]